MSLAVVLRNASEQQRPRALKTASSKIFRKSRASQRRSAAYRFVASRDFAYAYGKPRQDRQSLQTDPVGYEESLNLYAYAGGDPVNATDPTGNETFQIGPNFQAVLGVGSGYSFGVYAGTRENGDFDFGVFHTVKAAVGDQLGAELVVEVSGSDVEDLSGTNVIVEGDYGVGLSLEAPADSTGDLGANLSRGVVNLSGGPSAGYALGVNSTETFSLVPVIQEFVRDLLGGGLPGSPVDPIQE